MTVRVRMQRMCVGVCMGDHPGVMGWEEDGLRLLVAHDV